MVRLAVSLAGGGGGDGGDGDSGGVGGGDGGGGGPSPSSASTRAAAQVPWLPLHAPSSRSTASSATAPRLGGRPGSRTGIRRSSSGRLDWLSVVRKSCWKAAVARCGWVSARRRCAVAAAPCLMHFLLIVCQSSFLSFRCLQCSHPAHTHLGSLRCSAAPATQWLPPCLRCTRPGRLEPALR